MAREILPITPAGLRADEAAAFCGVGRSTWDELWKAELAPQPGRPRPSLKVWSVDELSAWLASGCPSLEDWRRQWNQMLKQGSWSRPTTIVMTGRPLDAAG